MRSRSRSGRAYGVAILAVVIAGFFALRGARKDEPRFHIERLPSYTAPVAAAVVDAALQESLQISLPPQAPPRPFLAEHRIVAYYGNPLTPILGVLGEQDGAKTAARLRAQADAYVPVSTDRAIVPALHFIYAVAQEHPGEDGSFLLRMDEALVDQYVRLARENDMLLILDIQMGRSSVEKELPRLYRWLSHEHVHVALDPEFAWGANLLPGEDIGHMTGEQINRAQQMLQQFAKDHLLPTKLLIVHQFLPGMVKNKAAIKSYDRVELVFDADGYGSRNVKLGSWNRVIVDDNVQLAGIKLFYKYDTQLMTPTDVLNLEPKPAVIIYQ
jgi:hypothetical protein